MNIIPVETEEIRVGRHGASYKESSWKAVPEQEDIPGFIDGKPVTQVYHAGSLEPAEVIPPMRARRVRLADEIQPDFDPANYVVPKGLQVEQPLTYEIAHLPVFRFEPKDLGGLETLAEVDPHFDEFDGEIGPDPDITYFEIRALSQSADRYSGSLPVNKEGRRGMHIVHDPNSPFGTHMDPKYANED